MTIKLLNLVVYAYAIFWTILIIVFMYQEKLKKYKFFRWINNLLKAYILKTNPDRIRKENFKILSKIKNPNDKEYNINGVRVYAPNYKLAHKKYSDVLNLKVIYTEEKLKHHV